jgi:hypothetical protein
MAEQFTVADAYPYVVLTWTGRVGIDLRPGPRSSVTTSGLLHSRK